MGQERISLGIVNISKGEADPAVSITPSDDVLPNLEKFENSLDYRIENGTDKAIRKDMLEHPVAQSRINIPKGNKHSGWTHVLRCHFSGKENASQFTIEESELKSLLKNTDVVRVPISSLPVSRNKKTGEDEIIYQRVVELNADIGIDQFSKRPTSKITILTDKHGDLITVTPGVIK